MRLCQKRYQGLTSDSLKEQQILAICSYYDDALKKQFSNFPQFLLVPKLSVIDTQQLRHIPNSRMNIFILKQKIMIHYSLECTEKSTTFGSVHSRYTFVVPNENINFKKKNLAPPQDKVKKLGLFSLMNNRMPFFEPKNRMGT